MDLLRLGHSKICPDTPPMSSLKQNPDRFVFKWLFAAVLLIEGLKFLWFLLKG